MEENGSMTIAEDNNEIMFEEAEDNELMEAEDNSSGTGAALLIFGVGAVTGIVVSKVAKPIWNKAKELIEKSKAKKAGKATVIDGNFKVVEDEEFAEEETETETK